MPILETSIDQCKNQKFSDEDLNKNLRKAVE